MENAASHAYSNASSVHRPLPTSTLQPSLIDRTSVVLCFSAPTSSNFSPSGRFRVGKFRSRRTRIYAACVSAKSASSTLVS
jgi:hypothetical protein